MVFSEVNYLAVIVAAVLGFGVGAVWYGLLFSKPWQAAVGLTEKDMKERGSPLPFVVVIVADLIIAFVLSVLIGTLWIGQATIGDGIVVAVLAWFGFVFTTIAVNNAFALRQPMLSVIDGGHWLAVLVVMGAIIGAF